MAEKKDAIQDKHGDMFAKRLEVMMLESGFEEEGAKLIVNLMHKELEKSLPILAVAGSPFGKGVTEMGSLYSKFLYIAFDQMMAMGKEREKTNGF